MDPSAFDRLDAPDEHQQLRAFSFFAELDEAALRSVWDGGEVIEYPAFSLVYESGSEVDGFYLLLSGEVRLDFGTADGREIPFRTATAPDFFGLEAAAIHRTPRDTTAITQTPVKVLRLEGRALFRPLFGIPGFQVAVMSRLMHVIRFVLHRPGSSAHRTSRERVVAVLLAMSLDEAFMGHGGHLQPPVSQADDWVLIPPVTTEQLARHASTSRETVSRILADMENRSLIRREAPGRWLLRPDEIIASGFACDRRRVRRDGVASAS